MTDAPREKIRVVVVDDEELGRKKLCRFLNEDSDIHLVAECGTGTDALNIILEQKPELLFLDIQMPERDGFAILREISDYYSPFVIFVTAFDQHAVQAFEVHALDYLLKPFDRARFMEALQRAKTQVLQQRNGDINRQLLAMLGDARPVHQGRERFMVKSGGRITFLRTDEIDWIEAQGDYVRLNAQGRKFLLREKIGDLETQLATDKFLRIHRSTIVNIARIKEMQPLFYGEYAVILQDGTRLTLSRSFRERVFASLENQG